MNLPTRFKIACLCLAASWSLGSSCISETEWVFPADGSTVSTWDFVATLQLAPAGLDPSGLFATLNDIEVPIVAGAGDTYTVSLSPGAPLRDENVLRVHVPFIDGGGVNYVTKTRFSYAPPGKSRAFVIDDPSDLMTGRLAHNRLGDVMLANDRARFVVQAANQRDLHSVGQYGGNLIDAELTANPGSDNFFEMQPSVNIETVINATRVTILNDGQDGTDVIIESCGPDDLIDYINASSQVDEFGATLPPGIDDADYDVEGCTQFILPPRRSGEAGNILEITTTLFNNGPTTLGLFPGDYINGMGELEQFTRLDPSSGMILDAGIGEVTALSGLSSFSYFGFGEATGVSYGRVGLPVEGIETPDSSFSTSGVSFILAANSVTNVLLPGEDPPTVEIPSGESASFGRLFVVGDGSAASVTDVETALTAAALGTIEGCVRIDPGSPIPAPGVRVSAGASAGGIITDVTTTWVTDESGCYQGVLPVGSYGIAAARQGTPFEGGGSTPLVHAIAITDGETTVQDMLFPATGRVRVEVLDPSDQAIPARVSVVGFDPSPEPIIVYDFFGFFVDDTGTFNDITKDPLPFGIAAASYTGADGISEFDLEPGDYRVLVTRGTEYSAFEAAVTVGANATETVQAKIARVIDTSGFVSSDFHVHSINSPDSRISLFNRVNQFAGEGVENFVSTDHDARTDPTAKIQSEGLEAWLRGTVGEEITTFDTGHFNGYPLGVDPAVPSGGATDWARSATPGNDFPSKGAYIRTPAQIHQTVLDQRDSGGQPLNTSPNVVVQINHIDSHFDPLRINTSVEPPRSFLGAAGKAIHRLNPSETNFFHAFPALELWNGATAGAQDEFLDDRIGVWMNLLNQAIPTTFIADTDTHTFLNLRTAGARTWTASPIDDPPLIDPDDVGGSVLSGRAVGGQGLFVLTRLREADAAPNEASLAWDGTTTLTTAGDGEVELVIEIQAPIWAEFDTVEIFVNAATSVAATNGPVPVLFDALPERTLVAGTDFVLPDPVEVVAGVPGAQRRELTLTESFSLAEDSWFVVIVRGTPGVSRPMFPVYPQSLRQSGNDTLADLLDGNLGESGVLALGATNALWADIDGTEGFEAPGVRLVE